MNPWIKKLFIDLLARILFMRRENAHEKLIYNLKQRPNYSEQNKFLSYNSQIHKNIEKTYINQKTLQDYVKCSQDASTETKVLGCDLKYDVMYNRKYATKVINSIEFISDLYRDNKIFETVSNY